MAKSRKKRNAPPLPPPGRPWALIVGTVAVVMFAAAVIGYGVVQVRASQDRTPEAQATAAKDIPGITAKDYPGRDHQQGDVAYDVTPPFGGPHDAEWADCTGTVYPAEIRAENAVHSLEHGAIWITYRTDLPEDQVAALRARVEGTDYRMISPVPDQQGPISLQSWGYQLRVDSASDDRIASFFDRLAQNSATTPEYGASCTNPAFKAKPRPPAADGAP